MTTAPTAPIGRLSTNVLASEWKRKRSLMVFPAALSGNGIVVCEYAGAAPA